MWFLGMFIVASSTWALSPVSGLDRLLHVVMVMIAYHLLVDLTTCILLMLFVKRRPHREYSELPNTGLFLSSVLFLPVIVIMTMWYHPAEYWMLWTLGIVVSLIIRSELITWGRKEFRNEFQGPQAYHRQRRNSAILLLIPLLMWVVHYGLGIEGFFWIVLNTVCILFITVIECRKR